MNKQSCMFGFEMMSCEDVVMVRTEVDNGSGSVRGGGAARGRGG